VNVSENVLVAFADEIGPWLLPAMVGLPLLVALVLVAARRIGDEPAPEIAVAAASGTLLLAVLGALGAGPYGSGRPGMSLNLPWVPALGVRFHLALDGVSAPLVLLTALLGLLVCWHAVRVQPEAGRARLLVACYLAVEGGAILTFTAQDVVLFFLAFEVVLVPMWFVIALWGDDHQAPIPQPPFPPRPGGEAARRDAANRFILFTALGSAVMLIGLLLVALRTGTTDLQALAFRAGQGLSPEVQTIAAALIVFGLAVKVPAFGVHTWLPPAHTIAPTGGSVLLAGVLLKMGSYGLVRVAVPVVPEGVRTIAPLLGALGVAGILWAGLACFVQTDLKRLIALSSVAHMGFVLLGIASMTPQGLQGALFANVAHGLITGLLFLTVGALKDRHHSADLARIGPDLRDRLPRLGWLLAFGAIAGLGLPGLAGFWGELLAIIGAWNAGGSGGALAGLGRPFAVAAAVGTVVAAAYLLRVLRLIWHGPVRGPVPAGAAAASAASASSAVATATADDDRLAGERHMGDATRHELMVAAPLVLLTVALGILPWLLLDLTGPAVRLLLLVPGVTP
jgi:NADH-quinone oxidoreductase subunit M